MARMERGQGGKLPVHQGHLWGKGLAAGGRRLEDANDAHHKGSAVCCCAAKECVSSVLDGLLAPVLYHCSDRCKQTSVCV